MEQLSSVFFRGSSAAHSQAVFQGRRKKEKEMEQATPLQTIGLNTGPEHDIWAGVPRQAERKQELTYDNRTVETWGSDTPEGRRNATNRVITRENERLAHNDAVAKRRKELGIPVMSEPSKSSRNGGDTTLRGSTAASTTVRGSTRSGGTKKSQHSKRNDRSYTTTVVTTRPKPNPTLWDLLCFR